MMKNGDLMMMIALGVEDDGWNYSNGSCDNNDSK